MMRRVDLLPRVGGVRNAYSGHRGERSIPSLRGAIHFVIAKSEAVPRHDRGKQSPSAR